jgi:uncharacterized membrane-anchored protein YhcB (DUF1043 family)
MLLFILGLAVGIFVGYKYPRQVEQAVEKTKQVANDLKDKITKKDTSSNP